MARLIVVFALVTGLMAAAFASASGLSVNGGVIQGGTDGSITCQTDPINVVAYGLNTIAGPYEGVAYVTVNNISSACNGADIFGRLDVGSNHYYTGAANENGTANAAGESGFSVKANGTTTTTYTLYFKGNGTSQTLTPQAYIPAENISAGSLKLWLATD